jgi:putative heme-binding domain-containing protein
LGTQSAAASSPPEVPVGDVQPFIGSLKSVASEKGDAARGGRTFAARGCATCHSGTSPIGPELSGPVARLSPVELMTEIQFPSRNIAEAFRATTCTLKDGSQIAGFTAFLSADRVILHTDTGTQRIAESDIASREPGKVSLMPGGLLTGLSAAEFADLLAYMKTLGK